jgi:hypothetical protein
MDTRREVAQIILKGNAPVFFLILSFLGVVGAVSLRFVTAPVDWVQHVRELPKSAQACDAKGGVWTRFGGGDRYFCRVKTRDAGVKCSNSSQCEGVCLAVYTKPNGIAYNSCSSEISVYGCFEEFSDGHVQSICRD